MDLSTNYLGMTLHNPLVISSSSISKNIDNIRQVEDLGASAVVLFSLFEEDILVSSQELDYHLNRGTNSFAEALNYFPDHHSFNTGPEEYLEHLKNAKAAVDIPIIASLNGSTDGGWIDYAKKLEEAGANALELNIYYIPSDPNLSGAEVEQTYINILKSVKSALNIPVAVKLSPFFSNLANMAKQFEEAGADGLVLFNRFYRPDIDLENLEVSSSVLFSTPQAMRIPLCWIGLLYGRISVDLAATSGILSTDDVLKMLMVGANVTMLCSTLYRHGLNHVQVIEQELKQWMEEHEYESVKQMQGSMSQVKCDSPSAFERAHYIQSISSIPTIGA
ncbi:MAG: dihydroorotate dehydrogenase-like protein [SAR324 cluster bacterium]|nr:dihydroorotate dehydrogenase-like protein [SAR324 cluster bacterium]